MGVITTLNSVDHADIDKVNVNFNIEINTINSQELTDPSTVDMTLDASTTMLNDDTQHQNGWRAINFTGRQWGDVISVIVSYDCSVLTGSATVDFYYRQSDYNSNLWQTIANYDFTTGIGSDSFTITDVDFNDAVDLRVDVNVPIGDTGTGTIGIWGGIFTTGDGTITTSAPTEFTLSIT